MESQLQNPEFRNNPENFHPCFIRVCWSKFQIFLVADYHIMAFTMPKSMDPDEMLLRAASHLDLYFCNDTI